MWEGDKGYMAIANIRHIYFKKREKKARTKKNKTRAGGGNRIDFEFRENFDEMRAAKKRKRRWGIDK
jgi:hypothetical protein